MLGDVLGNAIGPDDLTALVQGVANLLSNAGKVVPEDRTPDIRMRTEERDDPSRGWGEDNGVGVADGPEERSVGRR